MGGSHFARWQHSACGEIAQSQVLMCKPMGNEFLLQQVTFQCIQFKGLTVVQRVILFVESETQPAPDKMLRRVGKEIDETLYLYAAHLFTWLRKRLVEKALPGLIRNRAQTATRRRVRFRVAKQSFDLPVEVPWAERV